MTDQPPLATANTHDPETGSSLARRDFIYYATSGAGAVAVGAAIWPLINSMNPSADVTAMSSIDVDLSAIAEGARITLG